MGILAGEESYLSQGESSNDILSQENFINHFNFEIAIHFTLFTFWPVLLTFDL